MPGLPLQSTLKFRVRTHGRHDEVPGALGAFGVAQYCAIVERPFPVGTKVHVVGRPIDGDIHQHGLALDDKLLRFAQASRSSKILLGLLSTTFRSGFSVFMLVSPRRGPWRTALPHLAG